MSGFRLAREGFMPKVETYDDLIRQYFPHGVALPDTKDRKSRTDAIAWCKERHGDPADLWADNDRRVCPAVWARVPWVFYFKDPDDAFEFKLRWG